jgi:hypothetical protein
MQVPEEENGEWVGGGQKQIVGHISFAISHLSFKKTSRRFSPIHTDQTSWQRYNSRSLVFICGSVSGFSLNDK